MDPVGGYVQLMKSDTAVDSVPDSVARNRPLLLFLFKTGRGLTVSPMTVKWWDLRATIKKRAGETPAEETELEELGGDDDNEGSDDSGYPILGPNTPSEGGRSFVLDPNFTNGEYPDTLTDTS
ncbi:hypothetical protein P691DRAFT_784296 [Macrolepiota fuliginosa MF-IS2]|uniref:Uncharacterized protein n=1 Tax=Macrolepiota fuliginosa MF-IS2 TaxID=1400762 RepID=A0A9P5X791_9AGAR|nr:hypothetical protein P691DRAFT_784296 [Macrolepiota fuliginosa MF-IS2]